MASSSSSFPSSSISSTSKWTYDVFLSFSGEDTRNTATDFVDYALVEKGIKVFKDDRNLERGKAIEPELFQAIKESKFAVVILSENYASSTWCLKELVEIIDCEEKMGMTIFPIFYNVDPSDVRNQKVTFAQRFDEYEKQFEQEVVGTWRDALTRVANISGYHVDNSPLSVAVKSILRLISQKLSREFSEVTEGLVGIESPMLELESCLAFWLKDEVRFIGIWAMGGMGKTTLAEVAYKTYSKKFEACCFIHNVREKYEKEGEFSLQKDLISQILNDTNLNIKNKCEGEQMLKSRLCGKKILLVLDDVSDLNQLQKLVGKREWFGWGSRIIITSRDKHLFQNLVDQICEVKALNYEDALCLFCSKAFKKKHAPGEYLKLSQRILEYVNGVPLALDILGSFFSGRSTVEWEDAIERLKVEPNEKVNQVLKISFGGLQESEKNIFLDIACFFNHEVEDHVVQILENLGRNPKIGLKILIEKSLLKISENNELWMHDLLRDMGRDVVHQESPDEPGNRSRLWHDEDIDLVLKNNTGTKKVQAMDIRGAEACWRGFTSSKKQKRPLWNPNAFSKMSNLKFLRVRNVFPQHVRQHLPNSLRYLEWSGYSAKSLPCFQPNELVQLHLQHSKIEFLWEGMKDFDKLKSINMAGSLNLIEAPNFNTVSNLEELVLEGCSKLRELHPSIGKLKKLKLLNLKKCQELTSLPNKFELKSLKTLNLTGCSKVKKIPEFVGNMEHLQELLLEGTAITELPSSIKCLIGLTSLDLTDCKKFVRLPSTICSLKSLDKIILSGCSKFDKLPKDLGNIVSLKRLYLSGTAITELPSSVESLIDLEELSLTDCKKFVRLPSTICSLKSLDKINLSGCSKFDKLPKDLGNIVSLKRLYLSGTAITELPSSVESLIGLEELSLNDCKKFVLLPTVRSLKSLVTMDLSRCPKFFNLPEIGNLEHLNRLCLEGTAIEVLSSSVGHLAALKYLHLKDCKNLVSLPSTICNLKKVGSLDLFGCSKLADLPENLGNMESLTFLFLGATAIKELPFSTIHLKKLNTVSFKGCQLSSSSLTSMPRSVEIDLSDCNLLAIPSGIDRYLSAIPREIGPIPTWRLYLRGNDFVSLPESISQFSTVTRLYLEGCKSLRSLSNIPPKVEFICVDNCTSLERLPEPPNDFYLPRFRHFIVQCFNCFKLADNIIQNFSNMFQGQSSQEVGKCYIIPGREIPKWFEKANICDTLVASSDYSSVGAAMTHKIIKKVKIQLPGSGSGCDEWRKIVLCVVFLPTEHHHRDQLDYFRANEYSMSYSTYGFKDALGLRFTAQYGGQLEFGGEWSSSYSTSEYVKVESHHLWLCSFSKESLPHTEIDNKGFRQVELEIETGSAEVEKIGFHVV